MIDTWYTPKESNGDLETLLSKHFTGEVSPDRLDRIEELLEKQAKLMSQNGKGQNTFSTFGKMAGLLVAIIAGFVWLEGRLDMMVEKASPYARDKSAIEERNKVQDQAIIDLRVEIRTLKDRVDTNTDRLDTVIHNQNDILNAVKGRK